MPFENIYDLYNDTLDADKPLVDQVITEIKSEIETKTLENLEYSFDFDLRAFEYLDEDDEPITPENKQLIRIRDQVQFILRAIGIRCSIPRITSEEGDIILSIKWFIRNDREFMKTYY